MGTRSKPGPDQRCLHLRSGQSGGEQSLIRWRGRIQDFFETGPLAGKAEADCLRNANALFPE